MFKITAYVNASEIWPTAENHEDLGYKPGLVRGYNIEVTTSKGITDWMSCEYIDGDPEEVFNDDYHTWSRDDWGFTPTGRICFRGYGREEYDFDERETFIIPVNVEQGGQYEKIECWFFKIKHKNGEVEICGYGSSDYYTQEEAAEKMKELCEKRGWEFIGIHKD